MKGKNLEFLTAVVFISIGAILRIIPHPPNFSPITAVALFGGVYLSKKTALALPLIAMLVSDFFIGFYDWKLMASVYLSFLLCVLLGFWLKKNKRWQAILGSSILSSLIFFLITNFAVWFFTSWYAKTPSGIVECYLMALPFLKNTLLGDLSYTIAFFGAFEFAAILIDKKFGIAKPASLN